MESKHYATSRNLPSTIDGILYVNLSNLVSSVSEMKCNAFFCGENKSAGKRALNTSVAQSHLVKSLTKSRMNLFPQLSFQPGHEDQITKTGGRALVGSTVWISLRIMMRKDTIQLGNESESEGGVFLRSGYCFCSFES